MRITKVLLVVVIALSSASAPSQTFVADAQGFGVRLFLVPDSDQFVELWSKPETPRINLFKEVLVGAEFSGVVLYWGGGSGPDGNCDIRMKTTVRAGSEVLAEGESMPLCSGHAPPPRNVLALGDTVIDLKATGEPASLVVYVEVMDSVTNETLSVYAPIEVVAP